MKTQTTKLSIVSAMMAFMCLLFLPSCGKGKFYSHYGHVFGTYYNIQYQYTDSLHQEILKCLDDFDNSLSTHNPNSTISLINRNENLDTDPCFEMMFATAQEVSELTDGAFDITVAPLVNAWGFGFKNKEKVTQDVIDSLQQFIGYKTVTIQNHKVVKQHPETMLEAAALAKGQSCDMVAQLLESKGIKNYLVDIGGEVVAKGKNAKHKNWQIGISQPVNDPSGREHGIVKIVSRKNMCMATSGNYRQYYYEDGERRSHTIDPRTGYPVNHTLLSATIIAPTCMKADAMATACMVLGKDKALELVRTLPDIDCFLIYTENDEIKTEQTGKW